jgi:hypothetical protein
LGTPVVPTVLANISDEPESFIEDTPTPETFGDILSDDHLTIQNTIRNGSISLDDNEDDDDDIPISPNGTRRKSVTFSNETAVGVAASEKTESKKEKKKEKKEKKEKKNKKKDKMASISNINGVHNFTNHPIVKFKKMKKKHCRKLPPVPANDLFLQNLYNKLITASGQSL